MFKIFEEIQFIGKQLISLPKCRSTNDIAADMQKKGILKEGGIVITNHQHAGKGQRGNTWISAENENLTFSLVLKPHFIDPSDSFSLNILVSVAILNVLKSFEIPSVKIKWPNDIMHKGHKLGGILIENIIQGNRIENSIIGIGLNINQLKFDDQLKATSLASIFQRSFDLNELLNIIIRHLEEQFFILKSGNKQKLKTEYINNLYWLNEEHTFISSSRFKGIITGIDQIGRLKVKTEKGSEKFNFKEIKYLE